jgi:hypothetical protein
MKSLSYEEFGARARAVYAAVPDEYREGVDGLEVTRRTVLHPTLPEVYTLGECLSDFYPSEFGGPGEVRSRVVLYYGSFLALARSEEEWDWDDEIWETITHEIKHHLEHLASENALEELDYAEDQNFARRDGADFDPLFFRSGEMLGPGIYSADRDVFVELEVGADAAGERIAIDVPFHSAGFQITLPTELGQIHFLRVSDPPFAVAGELFVVAVRRRRVIDWVRGIIRSEPFRVLHSDVTTERDNAAAV